MKFNRNKKQKIFLIFSTSCILLGSSASIAHDRPALFHTHLNATIHYNHKLNDMKWKTVSKFIQKYGQQPVRIRVGDGLNRFTMYWKNLKLEKGVCDVTLETHLPSPVFATESFRSRVRIPPEYRNDPEKLQKYLEEDKAKRKKMEQERLDKQYSDYREKYQLAESEVWDKFEKIIISDWEADGEKRCSGEYIGGIHF